MNGHLIVTMGAPGSGKSTWAKRYPRVVSTDSLRGCATKESISRVFKADLETIEYLISTGREVVFDTTANNPAIRDMALRVAKQSGARATLVVLDTDVETCIAAQKLREHPVPEEVVRAVHRSIREQAAEDVRHEAWDEVRFVQREQGASE